MAGQPELLPDGKSTTETVPGFAKKTTNKTGFSTVHLTHALQRSSVR